MGIRLKVPMEPAAESGAYKLQYGGGAVAAGNEVPAAGRRHGPAYPKAWALLAHGQAYGRDGALEAYLENLIGGVALGLTPCGISRGKRGPDPPLAWKG